MISTSIHHLQANMVRRVNCKLARLFTTLLPPYRHGECYSQLENIEAIINESHHDTTEISPFQALWGRRRKRWRTDLLPRTPPHRQINRQEKLVVLRKRIKRKREKLLDKINEKKKGVSFEIREWVLAKACNVSNTTTGTMAKFLTLYEVPYKVNKQVATNVYILCGTENEQERGQYHANHL